MKNDTMTIVTYSDGDMEDRTSDWPTVIDAIEGVRWNNADRDAEEPVIDHVTVWVQLNNEATKDIMPDMMPDEMTEELEYSENWGILADFSRYGISGEWEYTSETSSDERKQIAEANRYYDMLEEAEKRAREVADTTKSTSELGDALFKDAGYDLLHNPAREAIEEEAASRLTQRMYKATPEEAGSTFMVLVGERGYLFKRQQQLDNIFRAAEYAEKNNRRR